MTNGWAKKRGRGAVPPSQFGADVTGSVGVLARAVRTGRLSADAAKQLLAELDGQGFHMSASLRRRAEELIDRAATD